ncbi:MAG TPA: EamA family transporter [Candidatus Deferrimicrobium sp.]|nr:EamA family transporter [Candidatus Deferrimicrobium sp.]
MRIIDFFLILMINVIFAFNQLIIKAWLENKNIKLWPINYDFLAKTLSWEIPIFILSLGLAFYTWLFLLKRVKFSILYPMLSIGYIIALIISSVFFKENVPLTRWIGAVIIILGVILIGKS